MHDSKIYELRPSCLPVVTSIGNVVVGGGSSAKVMGIINVSPESFFAGSVKSIDQVAAAAKEMQRDGAHIIDIGAMSTAPYLETEIPVEQEIQRLVPAIKAAKDACSLPISADTPRAETAKAAISAGAAAINDVTGLKHDNKMASVIASARAQIIVCAHSGSRVTGDIPATIKLLRESLSIARKAGIKENDVIVDPSIGFFRPEGNGPFFTKMSGMPWYARDMKVLSNIGRLAALHRPVCISASRKSFIGHLLNLESPKDRLVPSITCEIISVLGGANLVRTHNVRETVQALMMFELLNTKRL